MSLFLRSSLIFFVFTNIFFSQTDLLNEIDFDQDIEVSSVFKSLKLSILNLQSSYLQVNSLFQCLTDLEA